MVRDVIGLVGALLAGVGGWGWASVSEEGYVWNRRCANVVPKKAPGDGKGKSQLLRVTNNAVECLLTVHAKEPAARGHVHVDAERAVQLDCVDPGQVAPPTGHELHLGAVHARALPKVGRLEFCVLWGGRSLG